MSIKAFIRTTSVLALAATVSGCSFMGRHYFRPGTDPVEVGSVPNDYRTRHPIVISENMQTLDIPIATNTRELNVPVKSNIRAFAAAFAEAGTGAIYLSMPSGSPNAHAAQRIKSQIVKAVADGGASTRRLIVQSYDATKHNSTAPVRLSYNAVSASTAACGQWPGDLGRTVENENYHDYGCSSQSNLAAIVANPVDLLGPRQSSTIDAAQRAAVIEIYQSGPRGAGSEVNY